MKTRTRIATLLVIAIYLFSLSGIGAQNAANERKSAPEPDLITASISNDFLIQLPEKSDKISPVYLLDTKNIPFKSEEILQQFCDAFTHDFQVLKGDFHRRQIVLELDCKSIETRGFSKAMIQEHFNSLSKRMAFYFSKINQ